MFSDYFSAVGHGRLASVPFLIRWVVLIALFAFVNITAKRARDVGLPGWLNAIVIAVLSGGVSQVGGHMMTGGAGLILVLILAFLSTDMLRSASARGQRKCFESLRPWA